LTKLSNKFKKKKYFSGHDLGIDFSPTILLGSLDTLFLNKRMHKSKGCRIFVMKMKNLLKK